MLLASVRERSHEIHLLRVLGAPSYYLFFLMELEALLICLAGIVLGTACLYLCLAILGDSLFANFGLHLDAGVFTQDGLVILFFVLAAALTAAAIPSMRVYSQAKAYNVQ